MEALLQRYVWLFDLAVIALCATFCGRAASALIDSRLVRRLPAPAQETRINPGTRSATFSKETQEILRRNIFCSRCPPIPSGQGGGTLDPPPPALTRTSLPLRLLAVMFAPPPADPSWSIAVIRDKDDRGAGPYVIGSWIRQAVITDIEQTRVYLKTSTGIEYLDLVEAAPLDTAVATPSRAPSSDPLMAAIKRGIRKTGEYKYEVQRQAIDSLLDNMAVLSRVVRIVPEIKDGRPAGFRLFNIQPDGPFAKIGLQNGDLISAINGLEISGPDNALMAYTRLRSASHLSVGLERHGLRMTIEYDVR
jgi:general secretion pathway protein C